VQENLLQTFLTNSANKQLVFQLHIYVVHAEKYFCKLNPLYVCRARKKVLTDNTPKLN